MIILQKCIETCTSEDVRIIWFILAGFIKPADLNDFMLLCAFETILTASESF